MQRMMLCNGYGFVPESLDGDVLPLLKQFLEPQIQFLARLI